MKILLGMSRSAATIPSFTGLYPVLYYATPFRVLTKVL